MVAAFGIGIYLGFVVSPMQNFIPFLLLGIGVDDMFVLVGNLENIRKRAPRHFGGDSFSIHVNSTNHTGMS